MNVPIRVLLRAVLVFAIAAVASPTAFCATVTWDAGGGDDKWSTALNWSTDSLPTSSDDVVIPFAGSGTVNLDQNATVQSINVGNGVTFHVQAGWLLTVNGPSVSTVDAGGILQLDGATPTGGSFSGNGALSVSGVVHVYGNSTLGGSGALTINNGGDVQAGTAVLGWIMTISRNITNNTGGKLTFLINSFADTTLTGTVANSGIIELQSDRNLNGPAVLHNNSGGMIKKTTTSGSSAINFAVNNNAGATVDVQTGTLVLNGGGTAGGGWVIGASNTLRLAAGTFAMSGSPTVTGAGTLLIDAGTLDAGSGVDVTCPNVNFISGTITGAGAVRVSGNFTWSGGTIAGSGPRVLQSTSTPTISCSSSNCALNGATLQLQATATFNASGNALVLSNGASLTIDPGKTLNITNDGDVSSGAGGGSIVNNGTIWKKTTFGTSTIAVAMTTAGTLDVDTGALQVGGGVTINAGAVIDYGSGTTLEVTGGVFLVNSGPISMPGSGTFNLGAGTLRVPTGVTVTLPNLYMHGSSVIDGGGTLILSGTSINWIGGTMGSATAPGGITRVNSGNTLAIAGGSPLSLTQTRELLNDGTVDYGAVPPNHMTMSGNSKITNNGLLNLDSTLALSGSALIENNGTITKTAPVVNSTSPPLNNNAGGTVNVNAGTLILYGGGTERGAFSISAGAKLIFGAGGGTWTMLGSPTIAGPGIFEIDGIVDAGNGPGGGADVLAVTAPIDMFGTLNLKDATLQASSTLAVAGTIEHYGGAISGSGTMTINSSGIVKSRAADSNSAIAINTTIDSGGKLNVLAGTFQHGLSGTITVTNNGTIDFQSDAGLATLSGAPQLVNNSGTIKKSAGGGTTGVNVPVTSNSGSIVQAVTGTLAFNQGGSFTTVTISGAGFVALPATAAVSGTTTLTGKLQLTGNAAVSGTLNAAGTLLLDGGVNVTWPNVNLTASGSKIDGAGALSVSGTFTWSGGTITGSGPRVLQSTSVPAIGCSVSTCQLNGATLQIQAWGTYSASSNPLVFSNGASLILDPGQVLFVTNDGDFVNGGGAASSIVIGGFGPPGVNGCIEKTTTSGTSTIGIPVTMAGSFKVVAGTLQAAAGVTASAGAIVHVDPGTTVQVTGGVFLFNSSSVSFPSTGAFKVTAGTLRVPAGVSITMPNLTLQGSGIVDGGGTLTVTGTNTWSGGTMGGSGTTVVAAANTLSITGPAILTRILQNNGTLSVGGNVVGSGTIDNQGTLNAVANVSIGVAVNNAGQIATSNALALTGGGTHSGSFTVTAPGNLSFAFGTHVVSGGSIGGTGTLTFSGGTATIGVPVTVGALNVSAGTATLNANGSADAFTMTGGTLGGSGTLTLTNGGTWSGGTMSGSGTTLNPATKTFGISVPVTLNRILQNDGTLSVSGNVTGSGTIANNGTLSPIGNITIAAALNNNGQIATSALLSLGGDGAHNGTFTVTAPGAIDFSGGIQTISGTLAGTGTVRFSGAAATVSGTWSGMQIEVTGGSVAFDSSGTIPALTLSGGTLAGSGDVTVSGPCTWSGGTIAGTGDFTFDTGTTVAMPGTNAVTLARPLLNRGTINFTAVSNGMLISGVAVRNDGTFNIRSSRGIAATVGTPSFVNGGTLKKSSGTGVMQFGPPLSNSGLVRIESGAMQFGAKYTQTAGTTTVLAGTTLQAPTLSLNGGSLTGSGTIDATVANSATIAPGASPGTLTIDGDYVQSSTGALKIQLGGTAPGTQYDRLVVSGSVTLGGTLDVTTVNGFSPAPGNAFQILTFGSRVGSSTFAVMNGLTGTTTLLAPTFSATDLQLIASQIEADLAVSVSAPASVAKGSAFAYTVNVFNAGIADANGVSLTATLPPNVTFISASPSICSGAPDLVCTIGHLNDGSTATVVINVTAAGAGAAPIAVHVTANEPDSNTANNSAAASPDITGVPDVAVRVSGPVSTIAGTTVIYTATISNSGDTATGITVTANASPGLTFSGNSGACVGSFPCTIAMLSAGQSATIYSAWDIAPSATGALQLTVTAATAGDANSSNDSASAITTIGTCPTITILAPTEMTSGATAQATATPFAGAAYHWSIDGGTLEGENGTPGIAFTAGEAGTARLAVSVTGGGCTLGATFDVTVKPPLTCVGTAAPTAPADGATADAVVTFAWTVVEGASGYRLWLQQGDAAAQSLGTTLDTSRTKIIPPGAYRWFVETLFDGCASHESERRALTILAASDCASRGAPQLSAPANETAAGSAAVAFSWSAVDKALEYELWLAPAGGVPTLIRTTSDTSYTAVVPRGRLEWYVRAVFAGCASSESAHRVVTYAPPAACTSERRLLIAPAERERLTSPVSFEWTGVTGATAYDLYVDDVLAATTTAPHASGLRLPLAERRWQVRARLAEGCGAVESAESRLVVIPSPPSCTPLGAPVISAPAQISSGIAGRIQWSFVGGATAYVVEVSGDPRFPRESTNLSTVTAQQLPFTFTNQTGAPVARYVRVHAVDTNCVQPMTGSFSPVAVVSVLPVADNEGVALLSDPTDVRYTLTIPAELAGQRFTATPTVPWLSVAPASGIVPAEGQTLRAVAHTAGLPPGTSTGTVDINAFAATGSVRTLGNTPFIPSTITVNTIPGVTTAAKNTPPPDALIIPAVANVTNFIVRYRSDISVTNTSAQVMKYEVNFVPTGAAGMSEGQKTNVSLEPGATMALNDIVTTWFGGRTSTGMLEIRPLTEIGTSTSSAPVGGLANRITFASSRTFSTTTDGGTYGQYVPAVPYANFVSRGSTLSLQPVAESDAYRTNLGLVEGSGEKVSLEVRIFDAAGAKRASFNVDLNGGERTQLNNVLEEHGLTLDDGRIEVEVISGDGKVTAYASVVDNATNDPQLVPPVTLGQAGQSKWILPGVADLPGVSGNWRTDVRIFNAGTEPVDLTLAFYSMNGGPAATQTVKLAAGEVRQLDRVLSFFGITGDAGALHISSAVPAHVVATARTYKQTADGAYGQFIAGATPDEAVTVGSRPLQILQMEESARFKSNIGFAEVSGKPVTLEVTVFRPGSNDPAVLEVKLEPNQFQQLNALLTSLGLPDTFNARISVRAVGGEGRALAYGSLIDQKTGDPTYIPGQ